ncbi:unnamed protein product [Rhizoctonia solani]|uniref:Peptidase S8/S53 domain-containing protein n=1 Tax=Rhizoctonia solani TaxID=456999 RepID=A0A8H2WXA5_9AGAM|nr:unnamed protein product [Rhizoctonia solani]
MHTRCLALWLSLGVNVRSAWIGSNSAVNTISGTSMATLHVTGVLAVVIGNCGNSSPVCLHPFWFASHGTY